MVYVTKGNCDVVHRSVFNKSDGIIPYMTRQENSVLNEMLAKHNKALKDFPNLEELGQYYLHYFQEEIKWIESLPIAYEADDFIIIHAGIENKVNWKETTEDFALCTQEFYNKSILATK